MRRDVIAEMEQATGKHHSEFTQAEMLMTLVTAGAENRRVEATYKALGDTSFGMTWLDFKGLIQKWGFAIVLLDTFTNPHETTRTEELMVAWHDSKGLLLEATSFGNKINAGKVYGEVEAPAGTDWLTVSRLLDGCSNGPIPGTDKQHTGRTFDYDVREGLLSTLERIELGGLTYRSTWTRTTHLRHLWLVDYAQTREGKSQPDEYGAGGFYDRCTAARIARLPAEIQERIGRLVKTEGRVVG